MFCSSRKRIADVSWKVCLIAVSANVRARQRGSSALSSAELCGQATTARAITVTAIGVRSASKYMMVPIDSPVIGRTGSVGRI